MKRVGFVVVCFIILFILSGSDTLKGNPRNIPVKRSIYIIQEDRTFYNYFGTYPGANGIPAEIKLAYSPDGAKAIKPAGKPPIRVLFPLSRSGTINLTTCSTASTSDRNRCRPTSSCRRQSWTSVT